MSDVKNPPTGDVSLLESQAWADGLSGEEYALILTATDAAFDCGQWPTGADNEPDYPALHRRLVDAQRALAEYVVWLRHAEGADGG